MDDWQEILTWVLTLTLGFSLAACAGIRAWLPMLVAGLAARFTDQVELGESFQFLSSTPALVLFGIATVVEVVGDKIPAVDHALDAAGTFIRPVAGALLSASVLYQVENPLWALGIGILVGAPTAAVPHAVKSASRGLSSTFTFGLANPILSVVEDVAAFTLAALAIVIPVVMGFSVVVLGVVIAFIVYKQVQKRGTSPAPAPAT